MKRKKQMSFIDSFLHVIGFPIVLVLKLTELIDYVFEYEEVKYRKPELYQEYMKRR